MSPLAYAAFPLSGQLKCLLTVQRYGDFLILTSIFVKLCANTALLLIHINERVKISIFLLFTIKRSCIWQKMRNFAG